VLGFSKWKSSSPILKMYLCRSCGGPDDKESRVMTGFQTLFYKEWLRFWKVSVQTVLAPVLTALLYLLVFGHALSGRVEVFPGVEYTAFLIPGLAMMSVLQNSFANGSSSLMQSKMTGNIVFILLPPLSHREFFAAYLLAAVGRGVVVGSGVLLVTLWFVDLPLAHPLWVLLFGVASSAAMGALGIVAGIQSDKIDQLAAFTNFIILPLTFLSGVFYSIQSLSPFWQAVSHFNPVFYMIDGFRYGFFGVADTSPWLSLAIVGGSFAALSWLTLSLLRSGYKLRN
jgi:ABC-2 type transport system permease protein